MTASAARSVREVADFIEIRDDIKGGTAIIRGTRMMVYAVLGRVSGGETIADLVADNPDISREAFEAAVSYARAHPLVSHPEGRPWDLAIG